MAALARSVLVTGSNRGIGLELVRQLAASPWPPQHIFATCRDPKGPRGKVSAGTGNGMVLSQVGSGDPQSLQPCCLCCPGWAAQQWGQECFGGLITSPAPWIRQHPMWLGGMRLERQTCLQHSLLAVPMASQHLFCAGITQDGRQFLSPAAPFSCRLRGCCPTPSAGNGPVHFTQRKQSHPGSVTWEQEWDTWPCC